MTDNVDHGYNGYTCLSRFLGYCGWCVSDLDRSHSPNNYDCPGFKLIRLGIYEVEKVEREGGE